MSCKNGIFKDVIFNDAIKENIIDKFMILKRGDKIIDFMTQRLGIVFLKYNSKKEMNKKNEKIHELIKVVVKD